MTFLEQITLRGPVCDEGSGRRRSSKARPRRVNRRLTLIGICVVAPFIGPAACHVERVEARESRPAARVIVRPVVTPVSVPRVALHQDEKGGPQVFVYSAAERRVHARGVALGIKRSGDVDIASGLGAGEMIVVGSREPLADGAVVQRINEPIVVTAANGGTRRLVTANCAACRRPPAAYLTMQCRSLPRDCWTRPTWSDASNQTRSH